MTDELAGVGRSALTYSRERQAKILARSEAMRVHLPLPYLRQQAHLTAPASDSKLAEKALTSAHRVAERLLGKYGIEASEIAGRMGVEQSVVDSLLATDGAPVVMLDLEDGVTPGMVPAARANAVGLLRDVDRGRTLCFVRPAGVEDPRCAEDLWDVLVGAGTGAPASGRPIDGIVLPKVRHVDEVEWLDELLGTIEQELGQPRGTVRVSLQIETGWGVLNLPQLATATGSRLAGIILGTVDLSADLLLPEVRYRHPVCEWARRIVVAVAGAMGVPAIDGMTLDFPIGQAELTGEQNHDLVLDRMMANFEDCRHSIDAGMSGRWTGHPLQLLATELAFRAAFDRVEVEDLIGRADVFAQATGADLGAVAGAAGELLDYGTDRHVHRVLRRATAWGLVPTARALDLGLIDQAEALQMDS